jgi:hypothetical protein
LGKQVVAGFDPKKCSSFETPTTLCSSLKAVHFMERERERERERKGGIPVLVTSF